MAHRLVDRMYSSPGLQELPITKQPKYPSAREWANCGILNGILYSNKNE